MVMDSTKLWGMRTGTRLGLNNSTRYIIYYLFIFVHTSLRGFQNMHLFPYLFSSSIRAATAIAKIKWGWFYTAVKQAPFELISKER